MRVRLWAAIWLVCNVAGPVIVLFAWPKGEPASGLTFWGWIVGAPNVPFLILLGFARAGYEVLWYRAYWRNHHRDCWLAKQIRFAQRPLHVLDAGYCLPLAGKSLADVLAGKKSILRMQVPRHGPGKVLCNRFEDDDPLVAPFTTGEEEGETGHVAVLAHTGSAVQMTRVALEPLAASIQALTRYEKVHWPQVRVLAEPQVASLRVTQVNDALRLAALPPLEVQAIAAADGLLVTDAWLDARERRPLLAVAAAWYDDGIGEGLAEGCAAVLFDAGYFRLPPELSRKATLHRPVEAVDGEMEYGLANAAIWGKVDAGAVTKAWITRPADGGDRALHAAGFLAAAKEAGQCRLDRIVGNVGAANGLLAIAAAIEAGASDGPQVIVDGLQSAILRVIPADPKNASTHDESQK